MDPQRLIYPQRVPTKKRWADLTHLVHFADLADLARLSSARVNYCNVEGGMRTSCISWISCTSYISRIWRISPISQISAQNVRNLCRARACPHKIAGRGHPLRTQDSGLGNQDSGLGTQNSGLRSVRFFTRKCFSITCIGGGGCLL